MTGFLRSRVRSLHRRRPGRQDHREELLREPDWDCPGKFRAVCRCPEPELLAGSHRGEGGREQPLPPTYLRIAGGVRLRVILPPSVSAGTALALDSGELLAVDEFSIKQSSAPWAGHASSRLRSKGTARLEMKRGSACRAAQESTAGGTCASARLTPMRFKQWVDPKHLPLATPDVVERAALPTFIDPCRKAQLFPRMTAHWRIPQHETSE